MKETINISLSGIAFNVEQEGYNKLNNYLTSIKESYDNPVEVEELLSDIEARITEIILSRQSAQVPVSGALIDEIIAQLGFPIDEQREPKTSRKSEPQPDTTTRIIAKRFYRNPKEALLGGVCGGLASYFKIDPVIIRCIFVFIPLISFGFHFWTSISFLGINFTMVILYIAMWIIIPKARTPRQFLEMQGEPITKDNMERFLKDEMINVDTNISRITRSEKSATLLSSIFYVIGRIVKFFLYAIGLFIILGICAAIITGIGFTIYGFSNCHVYFSTLLFGNIYVNALAAILVGIVPLLMILFALIRPIFKITPNKIFFVVLWILWIIAVIYGSFVTFKTIANYKCQEHYSEVVKMNIKGGKLYVKDLNPKVSSLAVGSKFHIDAEMAIMNNIDIDKCYRHELSDSTVRISLYTTVFASSRKNAFEKLEENKLQYRIEGDTIFVNNAIKIKSDDDILNSNRIIIHKPAHLKHRFESNYRNNNHNYYED